MASVPKPSSAGGFKALYKGLKSLLPTRRPPAPSIDLSIGNPRRSTSPYYDSFRDQDMVSPMSADMRAARRVSPPLARPPQPAHAPNPPRVPSPLTMRGADVPPPARGRRPPPLSQRALSEYAESGDALRDQLVGMARFGISSQLSPESLAQQRRLWSQQDLITARREAGIPPTPPPTPPRSPSVRMVYDSPPSSPIRPSVWAPTTSPETRPTGGFLTPSGRLTPQRREAIFRQFPDLRRLYHQDT